MIGKYFELDGAMQLVGKNVYTEEAVNVYDMQRRLLGAPVPGLVLTLQVALRERARELGDVARTHKAPRRPPSRGRGRRLSVAKQGRCGAGSPS